MPRPRCSEVFAEDTVGIYTSAYDRIHAHGAARRNASRGSSPAQKSTRGDRWLSPIPLEAGPVKRQAAPQYRASDFGFLSPAGTEDIHIS